MGRGPCADRVCRGESGWMSEGVPQPAEVFSWTFDGTEFAVPVERHGAGGPPVLFLPAMSTVSTRAEWRTVACALANEFGVTLVDWPGFGESSRPHADYSPALFCEFLSASIQARFAGAPPTVVAAGHAAGYVLQLAASGQVAWPRAVLAAPTWRGPLPTVLGAHPGFYALPRNIVGVPGIGHLLYRLNTSRRFLRMMFGRHVCANQAVLTPEFLAQKQRVARQGGARFAAAAFVTGALDPISNRQDFLDAMNRMSGPVQLVFGGRTPRQSRAEMGALAQVCLHPPLMVPGALGLHEESADAIIGPLRLFLASLA